jgi:hypothetical protein
MDFKTMSIAQLKDLRVSLDRELRKKLSDSKADQHDQNLAIVARLQESLLKSQSQSQTQQAIAAKSEAEITARAEELLRSASMQRVIV